MLAARPETEPCRAAGFRGDHSLRGDLRGRAAEVTNLLYCGGDFSDCSRFAQVDTASTFRIAPSSPGKRASTSSRRNRLTTFVPSLRLSISPALRSTVKWLDTVARGRSSGAAQLQAKPSPLPSRSSLSRRTIAKRVG